MKNKNIEGIIIWCTKQKRGIRIIKPNDNICKAYIKKANNSLRSMRLNYDNKIFEWAIDASYYARYHIIYALFQKCGIKCEIHDCTINLIKFLFSDALNADLIEEFEKAKEQREDMTYYTDRIVSKEDMDKNILSAPDFVLAVEKLISEIRNIEEIRAKLKIYCQE